MYLYTHKGLILGGYYLVIKMLLVNIDTCSAVAWISAPSFIHWKSLCIIDNFSEFKSEILTHRSY